MALELRRSALVVAALLMVTLGPVVPVPAQGWPPEPENLQFFPEDIDPGEHIRTRRGFSFSRKQLEMLALPASEAGEDPGHPDS